MGGNSGPIIIRRRLRAAAEDSAVQDNLDVARCAKLNAILAKADGDWSDHETHQVIRAIAAAYDNQC